MWHLRRVGQPAAGIIDDVPEANIWVMDPGVKNLDTVFPLRDTELARVRGVPGVEWAVPYFKAMATVRTQNGELESALLIGADDNSLVGIPSRCVLGDPFDLKRPDSVAVAKDAFGKVWRGETIALGKTLELNDRRAVVVAIVEDSPKFTSSITFYTRYSQALQYTNNGRNQLSFVLVKAGQNENAEQVARAIHDQTGLQGADQQSVSREGDPLCDRQHGDPSQFCDGHCPGDHGRHCRGGFDVQSIRAGEPAELCVAESDWHQESSLDHDGVAASHGRGSGGLRHRFSWCRDLFRDGRQSAKLSRLLSALASCVGLCSGGRSHHATGVVGCTSPRVVLSIQLLSSEDKVRDTRAVFPYSPWQ